MVEGSETKRRIIILLYLRLSQSRLVYKTGRSSPPAFSLSEEVFSEEKASFPPPLALQGYVLIPIFCSYRVQTPISGLGQEEGQEFRQITSL